MLAVPGEEKEHACVGIRVEEDQASAYAAAEDEEDRDHTSACQEDTREAAASSAEVVRTDILWAASLHQVVDLQNAEGSPCH